MGYVVEVSSYHIDWWLTAPRPMPVPAPPEDIRLRLQSIEEHIIQLEREHPPWASLHFNQPKPNVSSLH